MKVNIYQNWLDGVASQLHGRKPKKIDRYQILKISVMALKPEIQYWSVVKPLKSIQQKQLVELFTIKKNEYETCEKR